MLNIKRTRVGSEAQYGPRTAGETLQDFNHNTEICIDLKTILRSDRAMKSGRDYLGILRHDVPSADNCCDDAHFTFIEVAFASRLVRRNVCIYEGKHITCTKRLDGTVRLNFRNLRPDALLNVDGYAIEVANEIREALGGLTGE